MSNFTKLNNCLKPREKLIASNENKLSETELLAIILQSGHKSQSVISLSQVLIEKYNGLSGVINTDICELMQNIGIGTAKATKIKAIKLISETINQEHVFFETKIKHPVDVFNMTKLIANKPQEHLIVICLDAKANLIAKEIVYIGTVDEITIHPREIFNVAIKKLSTNIIIVHNHPSGDPTPSSADLIATEKIIAISKIVGIKLIDHIIIAKDEYYSIRENCDIIF